MATDLAPEERRGRGGELLVGRGVGRPRARSGARGDAAQRLELRPRLVGRRRAAGSSPRLDRARHHRDANRRPRRPGQADRTRSHPARDHPRRHADRDHRLQHLPPALRAGGRRRRRRPHLPRVRRRGARRPHLRRAPARHPRADHAPAPSRPARRAVGLLDPRVWQSTRRSRRRRSRDRDRIVVPVSRRCCCSRCGASPRTSGARSSGRSARSSTSPPARPASSLGGIAAASSYQGAFGFAAVLAAVALFLLRSGFAGHDDGEVPTVAEVGTRHGRSRPRSRERAARHQRLPAQDRRDPVVPPRVVAPAAGRRRDRADHAPRR